jgi:hypothetical protein
VEDASVTILEPEISQAEVGFPAPFAVQLPTISLYHLPTPHLLEHFWYSKVTVTMVADALVYHPALAHYLRFVATTGT